MGLNRKFLSLTCTWISDGIKICTQNLSKHLDLMSTFLIQLCYQPQKASMVSKLSLKCNLNWFPAWSHVKPE